MLSLYVLSPQRGRLKSYGKEFYTYYNHIHDSRKNLLIEALKKMA